MLAGITTVVACTPDGAPIAPEMASVSASATLAASVEAPQYVVLGRKNVLPGDIEAQITAAGGRMVSYIPEIGVAVAEGDAEFAGRATGIVGVESVAPDMVLNWLEETVPSGVADMEVELTAEAHTFTPAAETFYGFQWAPDAIGAPTAWAAGITGQGARVAILDGGIHGTHIDLVGRIDVARSTSFTTGVWNSDVGTFWHGTHVAGIVAASANGAGTIGIAPEATIIGVKVLHNGSGPFSSILNGIVYAARPITEGGAGAHVINMSLGATIPDEKDPAIKAAVLELRKAVDRATTYAYMQGVTVIASAGNGGTNMDIAKTMYKIPAMNAHVISISSTGPKGWALGATDFSGLAYYSDHGKSLVTLGAPGGNAGLLVVDGNGSRCTKVTPPRTITNPCYVFDMVMSTVRGTSNGSYNWAQGTSMAAPATTGIVALMVQKNGGPMHPSQVLAGLQSSALDLGKPGNDEFYGMGWVNAWRAVR